MLAWFGFHSWLFCTMHFLSKLFFHRFYFLQTFFHTRFFLTDNRFEDPKPKRDPNMPKQPLSTYFLFSQEERLKVKAEHPSYSICEIAKELGRRWAVMSPEVKQHFQQMAEQARQKYDQEMAAYRQANPTPPVQPMANANQAGTGASTSKLPGTVPTTVPQPGGAAGYAALSGSDYSSFLLQ